MSFSFLSKLIRTEDDVPTSKDDAQADAWKKLSMFSSNKSPFDDVVYGMRWVTLSGANDKNDEIKQEIEKHAIKDGVIVETDFSRQIGFCHNKKNHGKFSGSALWAYYSVSEPFLNDENFSDKALMAISTLPLNHLSFVVVHKGSVIFDEVIDCNKNFVFEKIMHVYQQLGLEVAIFIHSSLRDWFDEARLSYQELTLSTAFQKITLPKDKHFYVIANIEPSQLVQLMAAATALFIILYAGYYIVFDEPPPAPAPIKAAANAMDPMQLERQKKERLSKEVYQQWWDNFNNTPSAFSVVHNCMDNMLSFPLDLAGWKVNKVACVNEGAHVYFDRLTGATFENLIKYYPDAQFSSLSKAEAYIGWPIKNKISRGLTEEKLSDYRDELVTVGSMAQVFELMPKSKASLKEPEVVVINSYLGNPWRYVSFELSNANNFMNAEFIRLINQPNVVVDTLEMNVSRQNQVSFKTSGKVYVK